LKTLVRALGTKQMTCRLGSIWLIECQIFFTYITTNSYQ